MSTIQQGTACSSGIFPQTSPNYRYFNQPIEQIPGWNANKDQILVHAQDCGLLWVEIECLPVVTCVRLDLVSGRLVADRRSVTIIKDFNETECSVQVVQCSGTR